VPLPQTLEELRYRGTSGFRQFCEKAGMPDLAQKWGAA
jgi:hypothetical protein